MSYIIDEGIKQKEKYSIKPKLDKKQIDEAIKQVLLKIDENIEVFLERVPASSSVNQVYPAVDNNDWTGGFWTGMLWLAYEVTGSVKYRKAAENHLEIFRERLEKRIVVDHHDMGFLYTLSCVNAYRLTENEFAKETAIKAADILLERYHEKAGIIQAWGDLKDESQRGRMIIDCNMNLPLLYWASEVTGDTKYRDIACNHVSRAAKYIVREDSSTYHTYYMDTNTGKPKKGTTHQGYSDNSCWARGQAWAIYGFPLSYNYKKDYNLIELTKKVANYYINRLPEDCVPYWDLVFTDRDGEEKDSSTAAIAACGLMELAKHLPLCDEYKTYYENAAINMVKSLYENYTTKDCKESNGLLLHGVYAKPQGVGVDECCIWGDYYYFEALVRAIKDWQLYW